MKESEQEHYCRVKTIKKGGLGIYNNCIQSLRIVLKGRITIY